MDSLPEFDGDAPKRTMVVEEDDEEVDGESEMGSLLKRRKTAMRRENGEEEMRRVAEIVLVLSAMGRMRGGRDPTMAEKAMIVEAREKVVALCEELAPKDVLPIEVFGVLIEDLGLNWSKEQRLGLGFRPPKLSISDKLALAKRKMEESKEFVALPLSYPSQHLQNTGAAGESHAMPPSSRGLSCDKEGVNPVLAGSFQPSTPAVYVSSAASTTLPFRPPGMKVQSSAVSSVVPNNIGRDFPSTVALTFDRAHPRPHGRSNGPSLVPTLTESSSADQHVVRTSPMPLQPQPAPGANIAKNKVRDHLPVTVRGGANSSSGASRVSAQATFGQTPKAGVTQTVPGTLPAIATNHPVQGTHFIQASPAPNHHLEISKLVQKVLDPELPERPAWTPPSRDYMNRAVACQFCKLIINQVENVLVCDACEKGFHLGCLQSYNAKGIPRGDWHCPRCLSMNHGKPFPPKYGRVTRNMTGPKLPSNTHGVLSSSEKKVEAVDKKVNQSNTGTNGNTDLKKHPHVVKVAQSSFASNLQHENEINDNDMSMDNKNHDPSNLVKCPNNAMGASIKGSLSTSNECASVKSDQQAVKPVISPSKDGLVSETEPRSRFLPDASNTSDQLPTSSNQKDVNQERLSNGVEAPEHQHGNCNGLLERNQCYDGERQQKDAPLENPYEIERVHDQAGDLAEASDSSLHNVDWIGDIVRVEGEKKFFLSCCINEVVYKVQDYALFRSGNGKLVPLKIQAMWEDSQTYAKWFIIHKCYSPDDLPEEVGRPGAPESNEVYESTHDSHVMAGFVQGPCEVLPFRTFGKEMERNSQSSQANNTTWPIFIRNWFYDESKRAFCPTAT